MRQLNVILNDSILVAPQLPSVVTLIPSAEGTSVNVHSMQIQSLQASGEITDLFEMD